MICLIKMDIVLGATSNDSLVKIFISHLDKSWKQNDSRKTNTPRNENLVHSYDSQPVPAPLAAILDSATSAIKAAYCITSQGSRCLISSCLTASVISNSTHNLKNVTFPPRNIHSYTTLTHILLCLSPWRKRVIMCLSQIPVVFIK